MATSTEASSTEASPTETTSNEASSTEASSTKDVPNADPGEDLKAKPVTCTLKQMTDAGQFSYSSICALGLKVLFDDKWHQSYKNDVLTKIFNYFDQPKQVRVNIKAFLEGHGSDEVDPYIEVLLREEVLKDSLLPLVVELIPLLINNGRYDARSRVLAKHLAWLFRINWDDIIDFEKTYSEQLKTDAYRVSQEEAEEKSKRARNNKFKRVALISLATVGGGTLIGLTGGLAAPLVAAGAGAIIGGAGAAALATTTGLAVISSLFGVAGAGLTGYKMRRRVGAVEEFVFEPLVPGLRLQAENMGKQLHITIAVNGWLNSTLEDYKEPWQTLNESLEQYSLRWESRYLLELGKAFDYIVGMAIGVATQEVLKYTILSGLLAAITWPRSLVSAAGVIDNPWSVCLRRSKEVGKQLAEVLLAREQGCRPVSLIGYSLGARVIYCCLEELSKRKGCEGIVEDVILLGAPVSARSSNWEQLQRVVSGKLINGYCRADWLLKFLYRSSSMQFQIAGLMPVKLTHHCMHNIDLSDVVKGHLDYMKKLDNVLKVVGIRTKQLSPLSSSVSSLASLCSAREKGSSSNPDEAEPVNSKNPSTSSSLLFDTRSPNNPTSDLDLDPDPDLEEYDSFNLHTCSDLDLISEYSLTCDSVTAETTALDSLKLTSPTDDLDEDSKNSNGAISPASSYALFR
ncbi:transmembrane and coiled-coil domain-containing protein 4 isoform X2 [Octopus sinensis]|uniref:Transmembrane and coiled-coil domain-containing protein 4 isoform X2 n=1 Tax=Octopus sinensis TaxID=2607531 RepID=A0A7E6FR60_9MOLL|nr:transmembrane and coiled-coil domain-containing protein 4 isoform X2 [Octopus sinensis]